MRDPTASSVISVFCPRGRVRRPKVHPDLPPSRVWPCGLKALWAVSIPCSPGCSADPRSNRSRASWGTGAGVGKEAHPLSIYPTAGWKLSPSLREQLQCWRPNRRERGVSYTLERDSLARPWLPWPPGCRAAYPGPVPDCHTLVLVAASHALHWVTMARTVGARCSSPLLSC